jgi:hypothetical protein
MIAPMSDSEPWQHVGEPPPVFDPTTLAGWGWDLQLPPDQAALLRSLELAEKAEAREREERLAARMEAASNMAVAESITRAHRAGEQWDPRQPLKHYPPITVRIEEAFAMQDMHVATELRAAKQAAAAVLREHGINAQVVIDPSAGQSPSPSAPGAFGASPREPAVAGRSQRSRGSRIRALLRYARETEADRVEHPIAWDDKDRFWARGGE